MISDIKLTIKISLLLPFMLFLVSPLTFYFVNINELDFSLTDIWLPVFLTLILSSLILFFLQMVFYKIRLAYLIFNGLFLGVAVCVWIQSQLMAWNFGLLDGKNIDWSRWSFHSLAELILWLSILAATVFLMVMKKKKLINNLVLGVFIIGVLSVGSNYYASPTKSHLTTLNNTIINDNLFLFHPNRNIIVIILDTFQSDYFDMIRKRYPNEVLFLDGFTFYRNNISNFPTTKASIPAILTGQIYTNTIPFEDYAEHAFKRFNLKDYYFSAGYSSEMIGPPVPNAITMKSALKSFSALHPSPWRSFIDHGLFRGSPTYAKNIIYNNGNWFLSFLGRGQYPPEEHGTDIQFLELFERKARIGNSDSYGVFRIFHYFIPHPPWRVDEKLLFNPSLQQSGDGYMRQALGALRIAQRMIKKLHELNIYDSTEIVILSDHGTTSCPPLYRNDSHGAFFNHPPNEVHASSLALMLHKKPFSSGPLNISDAPVCNTDLGCLLGIPDNSLDCTGFKLVAKVKKRERRYLFYDWLHEYWLKDYMPTMTEYFIEGNAYDVNSWRKGEYVYTAKVKIKNEAYVLKENELVRFEAGGLSEKIVEGGWSLQEPKHRWTDGPMAGLVFKLQNQPRNDLLLRLNASAFLAGGRSHQTIRVFANGQAVATWMMKGYNWYEARIPSNLIGRDGLLKVLFDIDHPMSPTEFGIALDGRKLGMAVKELVILDYQDHLLSKYPIYKIGSALTFKKDGNSSPYIRAGWSVQEATHRWTDGTQAGLAFRLKDNKTSNDLLLRLKASAYLGGGRTHQTISVSANGQKVASWKMKDLNWYEAIIPAKLVSDNRLLKIVFNVSNPTSPADIGESGDSRKLGIAARELVIIES